MRSTGRECCSCQTTHSSHHRHTCRHERVDLHAQHGMQSAPTFQSEYSAPMAAATCCLGAVYRCPAIFHSRVMSLHTVQPASSQFHCVARMGRACLQHTGRQEDRLGCSSYGNMQAGRAAQLLHDGTAKESGSCRRHSRQCAGGGTNARCGEAAQQLHAVLGGDASDCSPAAQRKGAVSCGLSWISWPQRFKQALPAFYSHPLTR